MRMVIPNPPGGTLDIVARIVTPRMTELAGQSVIIDNRPGADTNIGTELVARAPANGYTMMLHTVPFVVNPALFAKLPFDAVKDFAPVSLMVSVPFVLVVNNSVPVKSVKELIALARSQPGKLSYASAGNGSNLHVAAELFNNLTSPDLATRFAEQGADIIASTPAEFAAHIKTELARWAKVVKESGIKAE
jgi:tripartite-type tricarboxylate transporter receptor subunit TctC